MSPGLKEKLDLSRVSWVSPSRAQGRTFLPPPSHRPLGSHRASSAGQGPLLPRCHLGSLLFLPLAPGDRLAKPRAEPGPSPPASGPSHGVRPLVPRQQP